MLARRRRGGCHHRARAGQRRLSATAELRRVGPRRPAPTYEWRLAAELPAARDFAPRSRRRPLPALHRRARPACPRASCGATRTSSSPPWAAGTPGARRSSSADRDRPDGADQPRPAARRRSCPTGDPGPEQFVSLALGPLMHASGQWSALGALLGGGTSVMYTGAHDRHGRGPRARRGRGGVHADPRRRRQRPAARRRARRSGAVGHLARSACWAPGAASCLPDVKPGLLAAPADRPRDRARPSARPRLRCRGWRSPAADRRPRWPSRSGPTPSSSTTTCGRWLPGSGVRRPAGHARSRSPRLPQRPGEDGGDVRRGRRGAGGRCPATWPRWRRDGSIRLLGRGSMCINTGGEKVYPEEVEAVVKAHPRSPTPSSSACPTRSSGSGSPWSSACGRRTPRSTWPTSRSGAAPRLAGYKVPRDLTLVAEVPRSPSGKADYAWARQVATGASAPLGIA